jgi:signal transduction histidine kinase/CheY-like chemotaxis protein/ligand-binding sensor domain-containing protein
MPESYVRGVTAGPDGRIWIRHGAVESLSVLDGFAITRIPDARLNRISNFGLRARIYADSSGEAWSVEDEGLREYNGGKWTTAVSAGADQARAAIPDGHGSVVVLFPDRVAIYYPGQRDWRVLKSSEKTHIGEFLQMVPGFSPEYWITGAHGLARLQVDGESVTWTDHDTAAAGLQEVNYPLPGANGELFLAGRAPGQTRWSVARWDGARLEVVYTTKQDNARGWRGPDGDIWILDGASLLRGRSGHWQSVPRRGVLAGTVYDVLTERSGAFWVGTSEGLTRYNSPIWQAPGGLMGFDAPVHSVAEDARGRLWFSATEYLLELDGNTWRKHPLPSGIRTHNTLTRATLVFPDGRIALKVRAAEGTEQLLVFDPRNGRFAPMTDSAGRTISILARRRDGTFWVCTRPGFHFETWDGKTFQDRFDAPDWWKGDAARGLMEDSVGRLWIGGTGAAAVWHDGVFRALGSDDGFPQGGVFDVIERHSGQILAGARDKLLEWDGKKWNALRSGFDRIRMLTETRDGALWVASGSGLYRYQNGIWIRNEEDEGLPSNAVYFVYEDHRGRLWAGSSTGLSLYHGEVDREAPLARFSTEGNTSASPDGNVRIFFWGVDKWKKNMADRLLFSFRTDGDDWSPFADGNSATLHALKVGPHQAWLRSMDRNGNIYDVPEPLRFSVVAPWYRQGAFWAIVLIAATAIVGLLLYAIAQYRYRGRLITELREARRAAEAASRQKSEFLANMSHEIRTPMNAVVGMTELALELAQHGEQREYLTTVQTSADALLSILNDILDFSKIEVGKLELESAAFHFEESLRHVLRVLAVRAREKKLELRLRVADSVPRYVTGDQHRLQQVLFNLLGNAIKFTATGEVRLDARRHGAQGRPDLLEFIVIDTGPGVSADRQKAIFEPFEQEDSSTTRKFGGTGLGLAICTKLVELMQGRIWIESPWLDEQTGSVCQGSAFHFTVRFPAADAPAANPVETETPALPPLRILLAEDNPVNQTLAVRLLQRRGHTVRVASNGREAVELVKEWEPDLVLMDVQMPEMDGLTATRIIRQAEREGKHVPIVALTAHAMRGDSDRCLEDGMDGYLSKPIQTSQLDRVLFEAVRAASTAVPDRPNP